MLCPWVTTPWSSSLACVSSSHLCFPYDCLCLWAVSRGSCVTENMEALCCSHPRLCMLTHTLLLCLHLLSSWLAGGECLAPNRMPIFAGVLVPSSCPFRILPQHFFSSAPPPPHFVFFTFPSFSLRCHLKTKTKAKTSNKNYSLCHIFF